MKRHHAWIALVVCLAAAAAVQAPITGQWIIEPASQPGAVHLTIHRSGPGGGRSTSSFDVALEKLEGLNQAAGGPVRFRFVRDAGSVACEGWFKDGKGAGTFVFSANPQYLAEMQSFGYDSLSPESTFDLALHDVSLAFIRELRGLGYDHVPVDQLIAMRIHGVSPDFIKDVKALGYAGVSVDELIAMRIHGVTPEFIRRMKGHGFKELTVDQLLQIRIHGLDK
jgi:hypothetical protein